MNATVSVSQLQDRAPAVIKQSEESGPVSISRHGKVVAFVISKAEVEGLLETIEVLNSPQAMEAIRAATNGQSESGKSLARLEEELTNEENG